MEYVHLQGSEEVAKAGYAMRASADDMQRAANTISEALGAHQTFLRAWLDEYRELMTPSEPAPVVRDVNREPRQEDWQLWKGGFSPVPDGQLVWVKQLDGTVQRDYASKIQWRHFKGANYVIGWCV
jgi:hypothetical protein